MNLSTTFNQQSINQSINQSTNFTVCLSVCLSVYSSFNLPIRSIIRHKLKKYVRPSFNNYCMDEVVYHLKNYGDIGGCQSASADNILLELNNSSYGTKAEFNNCFIVHSKLFLA